VNNLQWPTSSLNLQGSTSNFAYTTKLHAFPYKGKKDYLTDKPIYITSATNGGLYYIVLDGQNIYGYNCKSNEAMTLEFLLPSKVAGGNRFDDVSRVSSATLLNERHLSFRHGNSLLEMIVGLFGTIRNLSLREIIFIGAGAVSTITIIAIIARTVEKWKKESEDIAKRNRGFIGAAEIDNSATSIVRSEGFSAFNLASAPSVRALAPKGIKALSESRSVSIPARVSRRPQPYYANERLVGSNSSVIPSHVIKYPKQARHDLSINDRIWIPESGNSTTSARSSNINQKSESFCNIM
jgi:hypothetical protein